MKKINIKLNKQKNVIDNELVNVKLNQTKEEGEIMEKREKCLIKKTYIMDDSENYDIIAQNGANHWDGVYTHTKILETIKSQKAITLIALVITIIVLLILAGVTIAMLTGQNGILTNATNANMKNDYFQAEEKVKLAYMTVKTEIMMQKVANSSYNAQEHGDELATLVRKDLTGKNETNSEWTTCEYNSTKKTIEITYTKSSLREGAISAEPTKPYQSGFVDYEIVLKKQDASLIVDKIEVATANEENGESTEPASEDYLGLKEGDTVYYKEGTKDIECTVLYASKDKTGADTDYFSSRGVQIITRNPVTSIGLGNGTSSGGTSTTGSTAFETAKGVYNDAINILNTAAKDYVEANTDLSAVAVVNRTRCVGSNPDNKDAQNTEYYYHEEGVNNYFSKFDGQFNAGERDPEYLENNVENYIVDWNQLQSLGISSFSDKSKGQEYWLASRVVFAGADNTYFSILAPNYYSLIYSRLMCSIYKTNNSATSSHFSSGIRPCITLKPSVNITQTNNKKYVS